MGCFPITWSSRIGDQNLPDYYGYYSIHSRLLPYLDQQPLYASINFDVSTFPDTMGYPPLSESDTGLNQVNFTVRSMKVSMFICPDDSLAAYGACTNYRGNVGVGPWVLALAEYPDSGNGLFEERHLTRIAQVADGLSHTAALSERLVGSACQTQRLTEFRHDPLTPARDFWHARAIGQTADQYLEVCLISGRQEPDLSFAMGGSTWMWTGRERTLYTHTQPPNGRIPDCLGAGMRTAPGMATARSLHPSGVCLSMGDGSVRFADASIAREVWRALGSRSGGEAVD
jgi:hypothetical protein